MENITVKELFDYLLKDAKQHKLNLINAAQSGDIPASLLNSEVLAQYKGITDDDAPDTDLDTVDTLLNNPQEGTVDLDKWYEDAVMQELQDLPKKAVDKIIDNKKDTEVYKNTLSIMPKEIKSDAKDRYAVSRIWRDALIQDRMLNNIKNNPNLSDDDKIDMALRLVFNYNTRQLGMYPEDWKLSQWEVFNNLLGSETPEVLDAYEKGYFTKDPVTKKLKDISDPTLFNKQRITADALPITYESDKHPEYGQLFTPSSETDTVFNIFVNKLMNDIKAGKAPDTTQFNKYIQDAYQDAIKTMTYSDWEKEIAKSTSDVDVAKVLAAVMAQPNNPDAVIANPGYEPVKDTGSVLGDDIARLLRSERLHMEKLYGYDYKDDKRFARHIDPKIMAGMIDALIVGNSDEEVPADVLTPEDWADMLPDNPVLRNKSAAEKADNKLNRFHKENKEAYKKYLDENKQLAKARDKDNVVKNFAYNANLENTKDEIKQFINEDTPALVTEYDNALKAGQDSLATQLAKKIEYRLALLDGGETELSDGTIINADTELNNWATRISTNMLRKKYDIPAQKKVKGKSYDDILTEYIKLRTTKKGPHLSWENDVFSKVDSLLDKRHKYEKELKANNDDIMELEQQTKESKPKEDWERDLVDMEEEHGYR